MPCVKKRGRLLLLAREIEAASISAAASIFSHLPVAGHALARHSIISLRLPNGSSRPNAGSPDLGYPDPAADR
jgi:hypothetical protein